MSKIEEFGNLLSEIKYFAITRPIAYFNEYFELNLEIEDDLYEKLRIACAKANMFYWYFIN